MNIALIFAGGTGQRMNYYAIPKQFLEVYGKPIIIHTLEHFEHHPMIDEIVIVCIESWIENLQDMLSKYGIHKVKTIVHGGPTGHESIYNGLEAIAKYAANDDIVLIHDGVRPLITPELIEENIKSVMEFGSAISSEPASETIMMSVDGSEVTAVPPRERLYIAKAPQSFYFEDIWKLHKRAKTDRIVAIDSSHLCNHYGMKIHIIESPKNNIKITEPSDYYMYKAICDAMEEQRIFGL